MKYKKTAGTILAFAVMILLLTVLFFASVNIGSLKVGVPDILQGMIGKGSEEVSTVFDLRLPRIFISILAGAATAVSGVLFQAVLKNPLADPGIIGISSGATFAAILITAFAPTLFFFTPVFAFFGGVLAFCLVHSVVERRLKSFAGHSDRSRCECNVHRSFQRTQLHEWWKYVRGSGNRQRKYYDEDMG